MRELPESWEVGSFGSYFKPFYGKSLPKDKRSADGKYPVVGSAGVMDYTDEVLSEGPTIVIGRKGNVGQVEYFEAGCFPIDTTYYIKVTDGWDLPYLELLLDSLELKKLDSSTATPSLRREDLEAVSLVRPPLNEQKQIVETINEQLSRLDAGCVGLAIAEARSKSFLSSSIQKQFATVEHTKQPLKSVVDVQGGMTPKGLEAWLIDNPSTNRDIPFYKVSDMNREDLFMSEAKVYLSKSDVSTLRVKLLMPGSVIFPKAGGAIATNKKRIVRVPGGIDLNCMSVTARKEIVPEYLYWWFQGLDLRTISDGSILPQISKSTVEALEIPCPTIPVQEEIVNVCKKASDAAIRVQTTISSSKNRGSSLRRSILHAAFTGQLTKESTSV